MAEERFNEIARHLQCGGPNDARRVFHEALAHARLEGRRESEREAAGILGQLVQAVEPLCRAVEHLHYHHSADIIAAFPDVNPHALNHHRKSADAALAKIAALVATYDTAVTADGERKG